MMATRTFTGSAADARWFVLLLVHPNMHGPGTFVCVLSPSHDDLLSRTGIDRIRRSKRREWLGKYIDGRCCVSM